MLDASDLAHTFVSLNQCRLVKQPNPSPFWRGIKGEAIKKPLN
jgi:hypothetical protein